MQHADLCDFLLQRIAEDKARVQAALQVESGDPEPWWSTKLIAEADAKREIVARFALGEREWDTAHSHATAGAAAVLDETLRLLALPYATHPDYREE